MKILIIGPFSPPVSGVSVANDTLFAELSTRHDVDRINFSYPSLKENLGKFSFKKLLYSTKLYFKAFKVIQSDCVYMTPGQTYFGILKYAPFILLSKWFGKKTLVHIHGNHVWRQYELLRGTRKKVYKKLFSMFDQGIVLSESLRKNLEPFLPDSAIHVVYNFVEEEILRELNYLKIEEKLTSELRLLFLSNLMKEKGILDFLQALIILKKREIRFKAIIAGDIDSDSKESIIKLFDELGEDCITYQGVVRGEQKIKLLKDANVFVFPTYYAMEGQPISLLEAMAAGNIVLTTEHAGIPDIFVPGKNGYYVKKKNPEDIASKLVKLESALSDHRSMMAENHKQIGEFYTSKRFSENIEEILLTCKI